MDTALEKGIRDAVKLVRDTAKLNCPVNFGALRESIKSRYEFSQGEHKGTVYTNLEYAPYVEFGTGPKGNGTYPYPVDLSYKADKWKANIPDVGWRWISGQAAKPYLYPAAAENEELIFSIFEECILKEIKKLEV